MVAQDFRLEDRTIFDIPIFDPLSGSTNSLEVLISPKSISLSQDKHFKRSNLVAPKAEEIS